MHDGLTRDILGLLSELNRYGYHADIFRDYLSNGPTISSPRC
jgi:hypothetical protein